MSKPVDKCSPFFKTLKKQTFEWSSDAEEAFQQLKKYLANLPKLVSPIAGEVLSLYVAISDYSLSAVLVAKRKGKKFPVYYIIHAYRGSEANYSEIEKVIYAVVMASRKLKPYFKSHQIQVKTSQPLKKILEGKIQSSKVADWSNQLANFGTEIEPRTTIKAQALVHFIAETTGTSPNDPN